MYASRHAVFVGSGRLPKELRDVLLKRQGAPQADLAMNHVRLLSLFDSAADAERISGQVQRLKIGSVVAGPEQPPADADWLKVPQLTVEERFVTLPTLGRTLAFVDVNRVSLVDWRMGERVDRAVLLTMGAQRFVVRASTVRVDQQLASSSLAALRVLTSLVDGLVREGVELRSRRLTPEDFGAPELEGDLLPLALAVVDAIDQPQPPRAQTGMPVELVPVPPDRLALRVGAGGLAMVALGLASPWPLFTAGAGVLVTTWAAWRGWRSR
jgi:hypothetical protein